VGPEHVNQTGRPPSRNLGRRLGGTPSRCTTCADSESQTDETASLFEEPSLSPHEKKIYAVLKADQAMHLDEVIEKLEAQLSSSKIFAAMFELELAGKVKQLPGKNFVRRC